MSAPGPAPTTRERAQHRTLPVLVGGQVAGSVGMASGIAVTALLARAVSGSDSLAGLGTTFQVFGGALLAVPLARLMSARGRRPGLVCGYALAAVGAVVIVAAVAAGSFPALLVGTALFGSATAANNATRYAAADLAAPEHRGRDLSLVVWAATVGSVIGPNLVGPGESVAGALHMPQLTGSYVFALAGFALAVAVLEVGLRPDPLLTARRLAAAPVSEPRGDDGAADDPGSPQAHRHGSLAEGVRLIIARRDALLGLVVLSIGHGVMVGVMVMTPLHMQHGGAALQLIGFVISVHILGMYALSPLTGWAVDRIGGRRTALIGAALLLLACALAGTSHEGMSPSLTVGLFVLGTGWSCTLISGSTLLTGAIELADRPTAQGVSDLCMGLAGATAGAVSGVVLERWGYPAMAGIGALFAAMVPGAVALLRTAGRRG